MDCLSLGVGVLPLRPQPQGLLAANIISLQCLLWKRLGLLLPLDGCSS